MTNDEWKQVEKTLSSLFDHVILNVDGYEITLALRRVTPYKAEIAIYINGIFKGEWLSQDCEERRRFLRKSERRLFSDKKIKELGFKGKDAEKMRKKKSLTTTTHGVVSAL